MRISLTPALALGAALALVLTPAIRPASAQATYDPLGSGRTVLAFDKRFLKTLAQGGVKLRARGGAKLRKGRLILPVAGGKVDPVAGKGTVKTQGTLLFERANRTLPWRRIEAKANRTPLQAKVGGGQLRLAAARRPPRARRAGFATRFVAPRLSLTAKAATRLAKKLRLRGAFREGMALGTLRASVNPAYTEILPRGRATLAPDPAMLAKLEAHFVSLNPIAPAELAPGPLLSLPIAAKGSLSPDAAQGTLRTGGAFEALQLSGGQLFERELWLDLSLSSASAEAEVRPSPPYAGQAGRIGAFAVDLSQATRSSDPGTRTISVAAAPLLLTAQSAAHFDEAFANSKGHFAAGERFGTVSFAAVGR